MGVDAVAVLGRFRGDSPARWRQSAPHHLQTVKTSAKLYSTDELLREWRWRSYDDSSSETDEFARHGFVHFSGPGIAGLTVGVHLVEVAFGVRWAAFLEDRAVRVRLRRYARAIARSFGSPVIAWLPDSCYEISALLDAVEERQHMSDLLRSLKKSGSPITTVDKLLPESDEHDGYCVELVRSVTRVGVPC